MRQGLQVQQGSGAERVWQGLQVQQERGDGQIESSAAGGNLKTRWIGVLR